MVLLLASICACIWLLVDPDLSSVTEHHHQTNFTKYLHPITRGQRASAYALVVVFPALVGALAQFDNPVRRIVYRPITASQVQVEFDVEPLKYASGQPGLISAKITNHTDAMLALLPEIDLPGAFVQGFLIDYPTEPAYQSRRSNILPKRIVFGFAPVRLAPGETASYRIPVVGNAPGNYSGKFYARFCVAGRQAYQGKLVVGREYDLTVLP